MRWLFFLVLLSSFVLAQPIVICDGCAYNGRCVSHASQINSPSGMLYCSDDSTINPAKPGSMPCSKNYECISFFCSGGFCGEAGQVDVTQQDVNDYSSFPIVLVIGVSIIFLILLLFLVMHLLKKPASKKVKTSKQQSSVPNVVKILPVKKKYNQFQGLEKQLEESTKKLTRK